MDYLAHRWQAAMEDGQWKIRLEFDDKARPLEHDDFFIGVAFTHPQHDAIVKRVVELHNANLGE